MKQTPLSSRVTATIDALAGEALDSRECLCPAPCGYHTADGIARRDDEDDPHRLAAEVWIDAATMTIDTDRLPAYDLWQASTEFARRRADHEPASAVKALLIRIPRPQDEGWIQVGAPYDYGNPYR